MSEDFLIAAVDSGPPRLAEQLPVRATVFSFHQDGNDRIFCAELVSPLRFGLPAGIGPAGFAPEYVGEDEDGPFIWAYLIAVRPDNRTEHLATDQLRAMTADLGIIRDQTAAADFGLDLATVIWAATVTLGEAAPAAATEESEADQDPTGPLKLPPPQADPNYGTVQQSTQVTSAAPGRRRRMVVIAGLAVAAVLLGVAIGFWMDDDSDQKPSPTEQSTQSTTSATATTNQSAPAPPPPPPPTETSSETAAPYYPPGPRNSRPNITTPQTRPPVISVRPTHRPAFPNQPGGS